MIAAGMSASRVLDLRQVEEGADLDRRIHLERDDAGQRLGQLDVVARAAVEARHLAQRMHAVGVELQRLLERLEAVVDAVEVLAVPATDLHPQLALLVLVLDRANDAVVLVEQLGPLVAGGGEALELAGRVLVGVVDVERVLEGLERAVEVAEVLLVDLRHLLRDGDLEGVLEDVDLAEEQLDERAPVLVSR
jgi:hypothetical protein